MATIPSYIKKSLSSLFKTNSKQLVDLASLRNSLYDILDASSFKRKEVPGTTYTVTMDDHSKTIGMTSTSARTVYLPPSNFVGSDDFIVYIKDEGGNAGTNNITVTPNGSDLIEGSSSATIAGNYYMSGFYTNRAGTWFII